VSSVPANEGFLPRACNRADPTGVANVLDVSVPRHAVVARTSGLVDDVEVVVHVQPPTLE
jgi:hypothetical protein